LVEQGGCVCGGLDIRLGNNQVAEGAASKDKRACHNRALYVHVNDVRIQEEVSNTLKNDTEQQQAQIYVAALG
jgi:hypothetical protein